MIGKWPKGRLKKRWINKIEEYLSECGQELLVYDSAGRKIWRNVLEEANILT